MKGTYILLIESKKARDFQIGSIGEISFKKGYYVYIGSALNGIEKRIERHIRKEKKLHWHIDFLLEHARVVEVFYKESPKRKECDIANIFNEKLQRIPNFGCSDCKCKSHLFFGELCEIQDLIDSIQMEKYYFNANT